MNMKKLVCIAMSLTLLLCGCAGGEDAPVSGQVTPVQTEAAPAETEAVPAETEAAAQENAASLGRIEGGEYTNEYVGYGCKLDSSWTFYGAEELQELPENVAELMEGTEVGDMAAQMTQISDMMAENLESLTTMNVLYTKLSMQERLAYAMLEEKEILEQVLSQKDLLIESWAAAGIIISDMELVTVDFLGQERYAIHTTSTMQEVPYYILQIYDYHLGTYGVVTTFASFVEDNTASLLGLFYALG